MSTGHRFTSSAAGAVLAALLAGACEGGSSSSGGPGGNGNQDTQGPSVLIQFPLSGSLTDLPVATLTMSAVDAGSAVLPSMGVSSVRVAGVGATKIAGLWTASVTLAEGDNVLAVEAVDLNGNRNANAAQLTLRRESAMWVAPTEVAFDSGRGEALVLDTRLGALFGVQPQSGVRLLRFGAGVGSGGGFPGARDVAYVPSRDAAVVTDGSLDAVLLVTLANGARSTLSSATVGGGPTPLDLHGIAVDEARNRLLVADAGRAELLGVDLFSGERTTLSADALGSGPSLAGLRGVALDLARNRALVTLPDAKALLAIDLATGNRTLFSAGALAPTFVSPLDVVVDPFQDRALVADPGAQALFAVDLVSGVRQILSPAGVEPAWLRPTGVALHLGSVPFVVDGALDALFEVGAVSGARRTVSRVTQGIGPSFTRPSALGFGQGLAADVFVVADGDALFSSGVDAGWRALVSSAARGSGPEFVALADVALSGGHLGFCLFALDAGLPAIVRVDPGSGDRLVVSGAGLGSGPAFERPRRIAAELNPILAPCPETALVLDESSAGKGVLLRVNLTTGERTILSDATHGAGPELLDPVALDIDHSAGLAYVLDIEQAAILSVNLGTGDREALFTGALPLVEPTDLAFDPEQLRWLIVDAGQPALLAAGRFTQTTSVLSGAQRGSGPALVRPESLVFQRSPAFVEEPSTPLAFVTDSERGAVLEINLNTGERVIRTK